VRVRNEVDMVRRRSFSHVSPSGTTATARQGTSATCWTGGAQAFGVRRL
jgi:hypothetical protein